MISYLLAPGLTVFDWKSILLFFVGGMLVTGSANAINQVVEKDTDAMMKRTAARPVASGRMSVTEGWTFAVISGIAGVLILWQFNFLTAALATFSLFLYAFIYTPLKKVSSIAVLVGAVPGALPCLIGWAAGNDAMFECRHGGKTGRGWVCLLVSSFSGSSRIFGPLPGSHTRIIRQPALNFCRQKPAPQNIRLYRQSFIRCCCFRLGYCLIFLGMSGLRNIEKICLVIADAGKPVDD